MTSTVVIMAAGRGTRMEELTNDLPKHLLPILGRPFLEYTLDHLRAAGFTEIIIVTGFQSEAFKPYLEYSDIRLVEQARYKERYGTAAAIENVKDAVGNRTFAAIAGDDLYSVDDLRKMTIDSESTWVGGYRTAAWQGMGVLKVKPDDSLEQIIEKPTTFVGDLINASLYFFTPTIFSYIERLEPSPRGEYEITDAINMLARHEAVNVFELDDRWLDLTAPSDITKIERAIVEGMDTKRRKNG